MQMRVLPLRFGRLGKNFVLSEVALLDPPPLSTRLEELEVEVEGTAGVVGTLLEPELLLLLLFHEDDKEAPFSLNQPGFLFLTSKTRFFLLQNLIPETCYWPLQNLNNKIETNISTTDQHKTVVW